MPSTAPTVYSTMYGDNFGVFTNTNKRNQLLRARGVGRRNESDVTRQERKWLQSPRDKKARRPEPLRERGGGSPDLSHE